MKFLVDELPEVIRRCPFSEWQPYPPVVPEPGWQMCKLDMKECNLHSVDNVTPHECRWLKEKT